MIPDKPGRRHLVIHAILLSVFLALIVFASIKYAPGITRLISRPEKFKDFLASYGSTSTLIYILLQMAQIIIAVIPGEFVQIAGGYAFGTALGTLYSFVGTLLGTAIVFFGIRLLGFSLIKTFISPKKLSKFEFLINNPKSEIALFILFLIPGIPKDTLVYISGMTPIKPITFILVSSIARLPGLWGSAYIGAHLQKKEYLPVWIVSGIVLVLFVIGLLAKDKIIDKLHRLRRCD